MNKNARKIAFVLLLLFIAGTVAVFALPDEQERLVIRRGYMDGWTAASNLRDPALAERNGGALKRNSMDNATRRLPREEQSAYRNGWSMGWDDQLAGNPHRYW